MLGDLAQNRVKCQRSDEVSVLWMLLKIQSELHHHLNYSENPAALSRFEYSTESIDPEVAKSERMSHTDGILKS